MGGAMSERFKELLSDAQRWARQALGDWLETVRTDPAQHCLTALIAIVAFKAIGWLIKVIGWIL